MPLFQLQFLNAMHTFKQTASMRFIHVHIIWETIECFWANVAHFDFENTTFLVRFVPCNCPKPSLNGRTSLFSYVCVRIMICYSCITYFFRDFPVFLYLFMNCHFTCFFYLSTVFLCGQMALSMLHFSSIVCIFPIHIIVLTFFAHKLYVCALERFKILNSGKRYLVPLFLELFLWSSDYFHIFKLI